MHAQVNPRTNRTAKVFPCDTPSPQAQCSPGFVCHLRNELRRVRVPLGSPAIFFPTPAWLPVIQVVVKEPTGIVEVMQPGSDSRVAMQLLQLLRSPPESPVLLLAPSPAHVLPHRPAEMSQLPPSESESMVLGLRPVIRISTLRGRLQIQASSLSLTNLHRSLSSSLPSITLLLPNRRHPLTLASQRRRRRAIRIPPLIDPHIPVTRSATSRLCSIVSVRSYHAVAIAGHTVSGLHTRSGRVAVTLRHVVLRTHDDAERVIFVADEVPPADSAGKMDDFQRLLVWSFAVAVLDCCYGVSRLDVIWEDEDAGVLAVEANGVEINVVVSSSSAQLM